MACVKEENGRSLILTLKFASGLPDKIRDIGKSLVHFFLLKNDDLH
jgi:hypothetical protein